MTFSSIRRSIYSRFISVCLLVTFVTSMVITPSASAQGVLGLPEPGSMVNLSPAYMPLMITGLTVHKDNPLLMDFIVSTGNTGMNAVQVKKESDRLIKYFLACLTIPENNQWVNLSPYEKQRIIPEDLGQTILGQDMLAQDYILKQLTASLIYPEKNLGKNFWDKVYSKAAQEYGTTQIPVNTFNKVWILPDTAKVYQHKDTVFVVKSHLKVMLDEDYLAMTRHSNSSVILSEAKDHLNRINSLGSNIIRQIILPAIEEEVNTGKNFAQMRQIYNSMILAFWYKKNLKQALLNQVYTDKSKINGVNVTDPVIKERIYQQYLEAYKRGVFNYIKEDIDQSSQQVIPRKYFSGGLTPETSLAMATSLEASDAMNALPEQNRSYRLPVKLGNASAAMIHNDPQLLEYVEGIRDGWENGVFAAPNLLIDIKKKYGSDSTSMGSILHLLGRLAHIVSSEKLLPIPKLEELESLLNLDQSPDLSTVLSNILSFAEEQKELQIEYRSNSGNPVIDWQGILFLIQSKQLKDIHLPEGTMISVDDEIVVEIRAQIRRLVQARSTQIVEYFKDLHLYLGMNNAPGRLEVIKSLGNAYGVGDLSNAMLAEAAGQITTDLESSRTEKTETIWQNSSEVFDHIRQYLGLATEAFNEATAWPEDRLEAKSVVYIQILSTIQKIVALPHLVLVDSPEATALGRQVTDLWIRLGETIEQGRVNAIKELVKREQLGSGLEKRMGEAHIIFKNGKPQIEDLPPSSWSPYSSEVWAPYLVDTLSDLIRKTDVDLDSQGKIILPEKMGRLSMTAVRNLVTATDPVERLKQFVKIEGDMRKDPEKGLKLAQALGWGEINRREDFQHFMQDFLEAMRLMKWTENLESKVEEVFQDRQEWFEKMKAELGLSDLDTKVFAARVLSRNIPFDIVEQVAFRKMPEGKKYSSEGKDLIKRGYLRMLSMAGGSASRWKTSLAALIQKGLIDPHQVPENLPRALAAFWTGNFVDGGETGVSLTLNNLALLKNKGYNSSLAYVLSPYTWKDFMKATYQAWGNNSNRPRVSVIAQNSGTAQVLENGEMTGEDLPGKVLGHGNVRGWLVGGVIEGLKSGVVFDLTKSADNPFTQINQTQVEEIIGRMAEDHLVHVAVGNMRSIGQGGGGVVNQQGIPNVIDTAIPKKVNQQGFLADRDINIFSTFTNIINNAAILYAVSTKEDNIISWKQVEQITEGNPKALADLQTRLESVTPEQMARFTENFINLLPSEFVKKTEAKSFVQWEQISGMLHGALPKAIRDRQGKDEQYPELLSQRLTMAYVDISRADYRTLNGKNATAVDGPVPMFLEVKGAPDLEEAAEEAKTMMKILEARGIFFFNDRATVTPTFDLSNPVGHEDYWLQQQVSSSDIVEDMFRDYDYRYEKKGQELNPAIAFRLGLVWAKMALEKATKAGIKSRTVLIARDARKANPEIMDALVAAIRYSGLNVVYTAASTPNAVTSYSWAVQEYKPLMSIFHTASHVSRPSDVFVRGFKVAIMDEVGGGVKSLTTKEIKQRSLQEIKELLADSNKIQALRSSKSGNFRAVNVDENTVRFNTLVGVIAATNGSLYEFGEALKKADNPEEVLTAYERTYLNGQPLKGIKIVVDGSHTPSGLLAVKTFERLGAEVVALNIDIQEIWGEHDADPSIKKNLLGLETKIKETGAVFGLSFDLDGDRGAILVPESTGEVAYKEFHSLAPDNLMGVLLPSLVNQWGYKQSGKKLAIIRDVLGTHAVNDTGKKLGIDVYQTDAGYPFLKAKKQSLEKEDTVVPMYGERSGHTWLHVSGEIENPLAVAVLFAVLAKQKMSVAALNPVLDVYKSLSIPYSQSPRFQPLFHPDFLKRLGESSSNPTAWRYDPLKPTNPPQVLIGLGKDLAIKLLREEFIVGNNISSSAGFLKVKEFNYYADPADEGGLNRYADIVFEQNGQFAGRFVFRASSNDPTFVTSYEAPQWSNDVKGANKRKVAIAKIVLDFLSMEHIALVTKSEIQKGMPLLSETQVESVYSKSNLAPVEADLTNAAMFTPVGDDVMGRDEDGGFSVFADANVYIAPEITIKKTESLQQLLKSRRSDNLRSSRSFRLELDANGRPVGGIDLSSRSLKMETEGQADDFKFNPAMAAQFRRGDFSGVNFEILDVTPVSLLTLLGFRKEEGGNRLVSV